ncbi:hypothetical protein CRG98_012570 [Punica granatum]|uniref:Uncharacterized protein n=1 Tax=Punica granatum TaxID=22663 RepID=A0A2I0KET9_PUNGR|nr:hypothetical protein CRG98_012570 [Punica granatum]
MAAEKHKNTRNDINREGEGHLWPGKAKEALGHLPWRFGLICLNKPDWSWSTRLLGPLKIWLEVAQWSWWLKVILMVKNSQDKLAKPEKAKLPSFVLS